MGYGDSGDCADGDTVGGGSMIRLGDITQIHGDAIPIVDAIIGGSPCQDLSIAGTRAGLVGERSGLLMELLRIVKEMRARDERDHGRTGRLVRPRYMVWENVPGAFSSNGGADFGAVLHEIVKIIEPEAPPVPTPRRGWPTAGSLVGVGERWSVAWRVLDAQFWGVPQRRRRITLVADFGGSTAPEILFERKGLHWDSSEGGEPRETAPEDAEISTGAAVAIYDARGNGDGATSPTLTGDHESRVTDYTALCVGNGQTDSLARPSNVAGALNCMHDQQIVFGIAREAFNSGMNALFAPSIEQELQPTITAKGPAAVANKNAIRRLTPLECERLQGYPDGWTSIGEWKDSSGKRRDSSDSARYKALGNSIALPPWKWVLKRLCAHYERDATMGSLFDGIGGFPLIWEQLNGRESCLWASEIEEFCIAVTAQRFGGTKVKEDNNA